MPIFILKNDLNVNYMQIVRLVEIIIISKKQISILKEYYLIILAIMKLNYSIENMTKF